MTNLCGPISTLTARVCSSTMSRFSQGTSFWLYCPDGFTAYDSVDAAAFDNASWGVGYTKCYSDVEAVIDIPSDGM